MDGPVPLKDLPRRVGETLPPGAWLTITQQMVDDFARVTGDEQWIHVDVERSKRDSPYKGPVAHGYLVLSLIPMLMSRGPKWAAFSAGINYGCEKVRFPAPVPVGARVRLVQTLQSVTPFKGGAVKVVLAATVELEGSPSPACYAETIALLYP
jgi:acyl dehydratase